MTIQSPVDQEKDGYMTGLSGKVAFVEALLHVGRSSMEIQHTLCPRSDPDIAHMRYYPGPLKLKYKCYNL